MDFNKTPPILVYLFAEDESQTIISFDLDSVFFMHLNGSANFARVVVAEKLYKYAIPFYNNSSVYVGRNYPS